MNSLGQSISLIDSIVAFVYKVFPFRVFLICVVFLADFYLLALNQNVSVSIWHEIGLIDITLKKSTFMTLWRKFKTILN
ncbi:MAG: hypothetical protein DWQ44_12850 [Bacteroidetes bacterium]|nr:MAG: hypothetical protein DWQ33_07145 [Bacteroidota bacterium]REK08159.1 MAG: hypothetical protein DWQ39_00995 [Bacteroidota bacterium]REK32364.1 MAG: hypothetical protein DWQ44_12850 [Bacteroidota bacterium]REK49598.1 MAG: hypothetical protein DWQ48_07310 [Bacteroidota bacterium]